VITRAVILAAGRGIPIGDHEGPNCLARVGRQTLIERTLRVLASAGIRQVALVLGWQGGRLRHFLEAQTDLQRDLQISLTFFENASWQKPNGLSVQVARTFVTERTMAIWPASSISTTPPRSSYGGTPW